jgi:hypothetical protein
MYDPDPEVCGMMRAVALVGGGAGAGGSVWINADAVRGEGIISANGGSTTKVKGRDLLQRVAARHVADIGGRWSLVGGHCLWHCWHNLFIKVGCGGC